MTPRPGAPPLSGRTVVVTGGTSGIGEACVRRLAAAGATVSVWSRGAAGSELVASLAGRGHPVVGVACDVRDHASVEDALTRTRERLGPIHGAVLLAGVNHVHRFPGTAWAEARETWQTNFVGAAWTMSLLARQMVDDGGGVIVPVSSIAALRGQATTSDYAASKAALTATAVQADEELRSRGVRVHVLTPGYVHTPLLAPYTADARFTTSVESRIPLGRIARPDEVAAAAQYLLTTNAVASDFVVDGGHVCA